MKKYRSLKKLQQDWDTSTGQGGGGGIEKGPVKLIKRVKIAHSFLQSVSN